MMKFVVFALLFAAVSCEMSWRMKFLCSRYKNVKECPKVQKYTRPACYKIKDEVKKFDSSCLAMKAVCGDDTATSVRCPRPTQDPQKMAQLKEKYCKDLTTKGCPAYWKWMSFRKICGSDGTWYKNTCEYNIAKCGNSALKYGKYGSCKKPETLKPEGSGKGE